jgi:VIT1/CCC1 family predicted Fe2+/Mn2+ transporter
VTLTSVPAAIPFLFIDDAFLALRISNAILLGLLFITGYLWSRYTLGNPWVVGLCFLIGGAALVAVAIALEADRGGIGSVRSDPASAYEMT